ncbi:hypothetical protein [Actinoplanes sp. DH11]|uniref:hypothetical protein n=1 Tax=Actinoplanes sp. DH11 TaxID=2857011 RepID=UPI001E463E34|nr:hypothetical protein [Actinoplanes sp. DH11]
MEPTSSPDNTRPAPGLARFWQVRPETGSPAAYPSAGGDEITSRRPADPPATPADLLTGFGVRPAAPRPAAPAAGPRPPAPAADPFGLTRAGRRSGSSGPRQPAAGRPAVAPPAGDRHGDPDHSGLTDDRSGPVQDVKSSEPEAGDTSPSRDGTFGGFRLGGTGRFLFGGRGGAEQHRPETPGEPAPQPEPVPEPEAAPVADVAEPGDSLVAEEAGDPVDDESAGATPADDPAAETPADADQDAADGAGPSDENGREDMNGRAGAPGYAQTGEASGPDGTTVPAAGDTAEEAPADSPRAAAGWAAVPSATHPVIPTSGSPAAGPISGVPVSPGFGPGAYPPVAGFTPDHPPLEPVSGAPLTEAQEPQQAQQQAPQAPEQQPADASPTSGAPVSSATAAAIQFPTVQIPATRTPPDLAVDRPAENSAPATADGGFGFGASGYSLGRAGEAFGVASVTPAGPAAGSVTPPPAEFPAFAFPESGVTGLAVGGTRRGGHDEEPGGARRSASLEDVEPIRRATGRRPAADELAVAGAAEAGRTVWDEDAARHFRAAWHEVKAEFVDDPVTALTRAHDLLTDAVNELTEVLLAERDDLDPLRGTDTPDTESMRMAMRGYREFLDRILSL